MFPITNVDQIPTCESATVAEVATEQEVATELTKTTKATKAKTKRKIFSLKVREEFLNKIKNEENNINKQIFRDYFLFQTLSYLTNVLYIKMKLKMTKL